MTISNFKMTPAIALMAFMCVLINQVKGTSSESIPVLLWSPEKRMSELEPNDANSIDSDQFHTSYLKPLMHDASMAAVVFLQDKLHTDDFTQFADVYSLDSDGGVFANIKALMEDNFSLEMPQVSQPLASVERLQKDFQGKQQHTVSSLSELEALHLKPGSSFLLVVRLPATEGGPDREAALHSNDELIGAVCKHLQKRSIKYVAAFTGEAAANSMTSEGESHSSRHLMATVAKDNGGVLMNITKGGHSLLFLRSVEVCVKNKDQKSGGCVANFTLIPNEHSADTSVLANKTAMIELVFNSTGGNDYQIKIRQMAIRMGDRWVINKTSLYVIPSDTSKQNSSHIENGTLSPGEMDFVVPILYSFHCSQMKMYLNTLNSEMVPFKGTYVILKGYQFQPFNVQKNRFFNSVDCVGFFTTGIWMGLFPVAILLIILVYGTLMLLDLSIMDRYDDPKGKTISVHTTAAEQ